MGLFSSPALKIYEPGVDPFDDPEAKPFVEVEATVSERVELSANVTKYPVEDGSPINDHVTLEPVTLDIDGVVSDFPLAFLAGARQFFGGLGGASPGTTAYGKLVKIRNDRLPVTIVTGEGLPYGNMVMQSLSKPRDAGTGKTFRFSASFVQVTIVDTALVALGDGRTDAGAADAETVDGEETPNPASPNSTLFDFLSGKL